MRRSFAYIISQYPEFHETFVAREVDALISAGHELTIYSLKESPETCKLLYPHHRHLTRYSPFFLSWPLVRSNLLKLGRSPGRYFGSLLWLFKHYFDSPRDLVKALAVFPKTVHFAEQIGRGDVCLHAHWATIPTSMAAVVGRLNGSPFTFTAHAWDIYLSKPRQLCEKVGLAQGVVTCTGYNVEYLRRISNEDAGKIALNYHGLDFAVVDGVAPAVRENSLFSMVVVGRLVEQKGFCYLIDALPLLAARGIRPHLTIIGDGPLEAMLRQKAAGLPEGAAVTFAGRLSHAQTLAAMKGADVMVAPSVVSRSGDRDGIPNVILEAMACGAPVVATSVSGIPEVVHHEETGLLVEPADPAALAEALLRIHDDPELKLRIKTKARELVERNFSSRKNIGEFIGLLGRFYGSRE